MSYKENVVLWSNDQTFAFNIWDINSAKAVIDAAFEKRKNIVLQTSASIYSSIPQKQIREFVTSYANEKKVTVWLNLDHCKDAAVIKDAIDKGWDLVMIDASDKDLDQNIAITNAITQYAHEKSVLVEAEVGKISGTGENRSVIEQNVAKKEDIARFLNETNVDMIAVAFGNAHGKYKGEPFLQYDLIEYTGKIAKIPFVVHGGSGLSDKVLRKLLSFRNVRKINISTDLKTAYQQGIMHALDSGHLKDNFQPVCVEKNIYDEIKKVAACKLDLLD